MFNFNIDENRGKKVHFIGIGGVSMSALAELLVHEGYIVSGSDSKQSRITDKLVSDGATVYYEHKKENVDGVDVVVYTDAISLDNEELKAAISQKLDTVGRADFLGAIMKNYDFSIAVSGTHGKTSTTSMITEAIVGDASNPTIMLGGELDKINGNIKLGNRNLFLTEACEYKGNILKYFPTLAIILNIDEDHLDYFDNINHIISTFEGYVENLDEDAYLIVNNDDQNSGTLANKTKAKVVTFGIDKIADYTAKNLTFANGGKPCFDIYFKHKKIAHMELSVMGKHNIYNALAAFIACHLYNLDPELISESISAYTGVHRRLEYKGNIDGIEILDDYAHHPTEIKATLNAIRNRYSKDIYCIFQPHTFTRTKLLLNSFAESFTDADKIIITDIYAAREKDYGDIHSRILVDAIVKNGKNAKYIESFEEVESYLLKNAKPGDCIITMGAGDVFKIGENILRKKGS